ncbi:putative ABC transporter-binding protein [Halomicronema hongdechloris C2206]|uniref:ABC transporter-binding protein n=1 Tax=Halomicronema hongdechloris C2206 TaxID=1641165 RepID=A0A1Z3HQS9_9CYAN|nr:ABC transporter substrate-binding protein [Halomicronema hongdechloris]ASC72663.1 putative ABC transporter-binding protein [Halomicronema hongdechloris C2206]
MTLRFGKAFSKFAWQLYFLIGLLIVQVVALLMWGLAWMSATTPTTLSFVVPLDEAEYWQPLVDDFEADNPDIELELVQGEYTTDQVKAIYTSDLSTGQPQYDLIYMDIIWVPWFASEGWLADLSGYLSSDELAQFIPSEVAAGRYQGRLYRIPFRPDVGVLLYNQAVLEQGQVSPPTTWRHLMDRSQTLQAQTRVPWGYLWQGRAYEGLVVNFVEVLAGMGGTWIDADTGEVGLDQPVAIAAAQFLHQTIQQGVSPETITSYGETESFQQFQAGESAFLRSWPYFWRLVQADAASADSVGLAALPKAPGKSGSACRGGWGFAIPQATEHLEQAWRAVEYLTSTAVQRQFVLSSGHLPSRLDLFEAPDILERYPHFPELLTRLTDHSIFRPQIPQYDRASQILQTHLWRLLIGEQSAEQAMARAAQETRALLGGVLDSGRTDSVRNQTSATRLPL